MLVQARVIPTKNHSPNHISTCTNIVNVGQKMNANSAIGVIRPTGVWEVQQKHSLQRIQGT